MYEIRVCYNYSLVLYNKTKQVWKSSRLVSLHAKLDLVATLSLTFTFLVAASEKRHVSFYMAFSVAGIVWNDQRSRPRPVSLSSLDYGDNRSKLSGSPSRSRELPFS